MKTCSCSCILYIINPEVCKTCPNSINNEIYSTISEIMKIWKDSPLIDKKISTTLEEYFNNSGITEPTLPGRL